jgi:hypothetical protein
MMSDTARLGQRFYNARLSAFGIPLSITWIVQQSWIGGDGIQYVRLVKESDPTEKKTVAATVLGNRRHFVPAIVDQ